MGKLIKFILFLLLICYPVFSQNLSLSVSNNFIHSLIYETDNLKSFLHPDERLASEQLGISYSSVKNKFLISNDIDPEIREGIRKGILQYKLNTDILNNNYSRLNFIVSEKNYHKEYYFKDSLLVSAPIYYSDRWKIIKIRYFEFYISDPSTVNDYSIQNLDKYVDKISLLLNFSSTDLAALSADKIK